MREELKIPLTTICARLERAIHADVGMKGLNILLFGYGQKYGINLNALFYQREKREGYAYLTPRELQIFSNYAGVNLSVD